MSWLQQSARLLAIAGLALFANHANAGDDGGNFMVRVLATGVLPDTEAGAISLNGVPGAVPPDSYEVSDEIIPALTLTYFLNKNLAVELFCCFAKHDVDGKAPGLAGVDVGSTWIFPPALTLQYHFDSMGALKPYVGAGIQYIKFFDAESHDLGGTMDIDDAVGFTLQAGVDIAIGSGWYLNADVKKTWLDTDWEIRSGANNFAGEFDLDPLIVSAGVGYRFNLEDVFGQRDSVTSLK